MAEYIEREALLKEIDDLKRSPWYNDDYGNGTRLARHDGVKCVVDLCIKQAPTADVVEVVHGKWVKDTTFDLCGIDYYKCSVCNKEQQIKYPYCPNCGAKMDGERSNASE